MYRNVNSIHPVREEKILNYAEGDYAALFFHTCPWHVPHRNDVDG